MRLAVFLLLAGCSFDDHRAEELCPEAGACAADLVCSRGLCRPPGALDADATVVRDATPRLDGRFVDARPPADATVRDAFSAPLDAAVPDVGRPPADAERPPPPPDMMPPTEPPPIVPEMPPPPPVPEVGLEGCAPDRWCVYAEADATITATLPDWALGGIESPLVIGTSRDWGQASVLLRFNLTGLEGVTVDEVLLYLDGQGGELRGGERTVEGLRVDVGWNEATVTWNTRPEPAGNRLELGPPQRTFGPTRWPVTSVLNRGGPLVLPASVALQLDLDGEGWLLFVNRENGAAGARGLPPRLEFRLAP